MDIPYPTCSMYCECLTENSIDLNCVNSISTHNRITINISIIYGGMAWFSGSTYTQPRLEADVWILNSYVWKKVCAPATAAAVTTATKEHWLWGSHWAWHAMWIGWNGRMWIEWQTYKSPEYTKITYMPFHRLSRSSFVFHLIYLIFAMLLLSSTNVDVPLIDKTFPLR